MNNLLIIDSSETSLNVSAKLNGNFYFAQNSEIRKQESTLFVLINEVLQKANFKVKDLDGLGVCYGPGSFTGIRLGLVSMRTLSLVNHIPLLGFNKCNLYAFVYQNKIDDIHNLCAMIDGKMKKVYYKIFSSDKDFNTKDDTPINVLEEMKRDSKTYYICGSGAKLYQDTFLDSILLDTPLTAKDYVNYCLLHKDHFTLDPSSILPLYIRPSQALKK